MSVLCLLEKTWAVVKQHISPLAGKFGFSDELLATHLWHILAHVPNVDILNRWSPLAAESQLQGKRLRWLGHVFRMPNNE